VNKPKHGKRGAQFAIHVGEVRDPWNGFFQTGI